MDIIKQNPVYHADNLNWVLHQPWFKDNGKNLLLALLVGGTSVAVGKIAYPILRKSLAFFSIARDDELPLGLPNDANLCYLNALLQAMASCPTIVKSIRHSASVKRDRLRCSLAAVLEGLTCSSGYLRRHNLIETILFAQKALIDELVLTGKWAVNDQQDVHELYGFFLDLADCEEVGQPRSKFGEGLCAVSRLLLSPIPPYTAGTASSTDSVVVETAQHLHQRACLSPCLAFNSPACTRQPSLRYTPNSVRNLIVSQIFCTKCSYRGKLRLVPESCIILFPEKSRRIHTKNRSSETKAAYKVTMEVLLNDEFRTAERLTGIHCPQCRAKALYVPEGLINDPAPLVADRSAIRHIAEAQCRNTCFTRRWIALPHAASNSAPPPPLVICMQRAVWLPIKSICPADEDFVLNFSAGGMMIKCPDHVAFPDTIDISPYVASGCTSAGVARYLHSLGIGSGENCKKTSHCYALRSVIVHHGKTLHAGHYVAYRRWRDNKKGGDGAWVLASDRYLSRVSFASVQAAQVYMLFYEPLEEKDRENGPTEMSSSSPADTNHKEENGRDEADASEEDEDEAEDGADVPPNWARGLEELNSPAKRIRALMATACGVLEIV